jgi:hypothetical protein
MHGLIREKYSFGANPGSKDLARHLFIRMLSGKVVIVAEKPATLMPALRKQWLKLNGKVRRECSSTANMSRVRELTELSAAMLCLHFSRKWPPDAYDDPADVYIVTVEQLERWAPECKTLYVTCDVALERLHVITSLMPRGALVVECKLAK